jgi:mannose-6-phosphate isomerase-like protein (cupin superfamily)
VLEDAASPDGFARHTVAHGVFAYYPSGFAHTIHNASPAPVTYAMLKWTSWNPKRGGTLGHRLVRFGRSGGEEVAMEQLLAGRTGWLGDLRVHATTMLPGGGYAEHADGYDVVVIVLAGEVETLGRRIGPNSAVFYARGERHGMRNPGGEPAFYLVVELHSRGPRLEAQLRRLKALRQRVAPAR